MDGSNFNPADVERTFSLLHASSEVVELRALNTPRATVSGYFNNLADFLAAVERWNGHAAGVYATLNSLDEALLARSANIEHEYAKATTTDREIVRRRRVLIDADPVRPSRISSTDAEHEAALVRAQEIRAFLAERGWPAPVLADSGNGAHLLYGVDLPNDQESKKLVEGVLIALSAAFSDEVVSIDTSTSNAARMTKVYGTVACKGSDTADRPHRLSRLLDVPDTLDDVTLEQLQSFVESITPEDAVSPSTREGRSFDLDAFIKEHLPEARGPVDWNQGHKWILPTCPWNSEHQNESAFILRFKDGGVAAGCLHDSCRGKRWQDLRVVFDSNAYTSTSDGGGAETASQRLIRIASQTTLFHDATKVAYARITNGDHRENYAVRSSAFKQYLGFRYYTETGKAPGNNAFTDALNVIEAKARFEGEEQRVFVRVAASGDNVYLDLGDALWRAVEISADGWQMVSDPPVTFVRSPEVYALPEPARGGNLAQLRRFINLRSRGEFRLLIANITMMFLPEGPYPCSIINGEPGSAKSTAARAIRGLVDPKKAPLKLRLRDERDLMITALNSHIVAFDNVSGIPVWLSDTVCSLATGVGFSTRLLYSDTDEVVIDVQRPVIINGIEFATRSDLMDRSVIFTLPAIEEEGRVTEKKFWRRYNAALPQLLGALLDAVAGGLRERPHVVLKKAPRMADYAEWGVAIERALGWPAGSFLDAYHANRRGAAAATLEDNVIGVAIIKYLEGNVDDLEGTATEILVKLRDFAMRSGIDTQARGWPRSASSFSAGLRRLEGLLRERGITLRRWEQGANQDRMIEIRLGGDGTTATPDDGRPRTANSGYSRQRRSERRQAPAPSNATPPPGIESDGLADFIDNLDAVEAPGTGDHEESPSGAAEEGDAQREGLG